MEWHMLNEQTRQVYYQALLAKDREFEGIFFVGVTTTGVFCRPTCPARKPKMEHCDFFETAQEALLAGYRPCKRCRPLDLPRHSELIQPLIAAVEQDPEKRWKELDFAQLAGNSVTARRHFKKQFGMTFIQYARARRLGLALKQIRDGSPIIEAQLASGYDSGSGFRDAFSRMMGAPPSQAKDSLLLTAAWIETPLGSMLAIADDQGLYLLEFVDRRGLEREIERLRKRTGAAILPGMTRPLLLITQELKLYFAGKLNQFHTPLRLIGSPFQLAVWEALRQIPSGETRSYSELAQSMGAPSACRAVARANGSNQLAIIIPCHRVIQANGTLGGYGGGVVRKEWLLKHERKTNG